MKGAVAFPKQLTLCAAVEASTTGPVVSVGIILEQAAESCPGTGRDALAGKQQVHWVAHWEA